MASVTLGQRPGQHHLETEKLLLQKIASGGKRLIRRASREKSVRKAVDRRRFSEASCGSGSDRWAVEADGDGHHGDRVAVATEAGLRRLKSGKEENGGRRSSMKESRSGPGRQSFRGSLRAGAGAGAGAGDGSAPEGLQLDRVTQAKSGVVKLVNERPRRQAWSIFAQEDPRVRREKGEGHLFVNKTMSRDWCDACNRPITSTSRECKHCSYTCHLECESLVQLDCNQRDGLTEEAQTGAPCRPYTSPPSVKNATEDVEEKSLTEEEVKVKIEEYNSKVSENGMKLGADGTYTGFIKVHLKLRRPVTVLSPADGTEKRSSFYMPSDAVKQLHVSSTTTVTEVICGLLKKFMVQDNPRKFALYRQTRRDSQDLFQKLSGSENPLHLRLLAGPDLENLSFVLKENETGDVEWHAFSLPELQNFLIILEKEESERMKQVHQRYETYRQKLSEALKEVQNKPG